MRINAFVVTAALVLALSSGCAQADEPDYLQFVKRALIEVKPEIYDDYAGTYRLPSGALFTVVHEGDRLMAGIPPYELLPQTTRRFASNRNPAQIEFERNAAGRVDRLNFQLANRDLWIERVDPAAVDDPTTLADAGGHRLRMLITGDAHAGPTIVVEDGFGSSIEMRCELQAELSKFARVVTYDHAGTGGSEEGPRPRHARQIAKELHTALRNAGLAPPYLLVGGSIGVDYMLVFARDYPADVAGIVLEDPTPHWDDLHAWMRTHSPENAASFEKMTQMADAAGDEMMKHQEPARGGEWAALDVTREQARKTLPFSTVPVVQITGAAGRKLHRSPRDKVKFFNDWLAANLPTAKHVLSEKGGHAIFAAEPELVIREIRDLWETVRDD